MSDEGVSLGEPRYYTHDDRIRQLRDLAKASRRAGPLFIENGYGEVGQAYLDLADAADAIVVDGFDQDNLRALANVEPPLPNWLHPKALDYDASRPPWQDAVADLVPQIQRLQLELRALATYDRS